VLGLAAALVGCTGHGHKKVTASSRKPVAASSTTSHPPADERSAVIAACKAWNGNGAGPDASAIQVNGIQKDAARQVSAAAATSSQWRSLADAMTQNAELPLTGITPEQQAAGERYDATIYLECGRFGVTVPVPAMPDGEFIASAPDADAVNRNASFVIRCGKTTDGGVIQPTTVALAIDASVVAIESNPDDPAAGHVTDVLIGDWLKSSRQGEWTVVVKHNRAQSIQSSTVPSDHSPCK
jgi:hypothetical protein